MCVLLEGNFACAEKAAEKRSFILLLPRPPSHRRPGHPGANLLPAWRLLDYGKLSSSFQSVGAQPHPPVRRPSSDTATRRGCVKVKFPTLLLSRPATCPQARSSSSHLTGKDQVQSRAKCISRRANKYTACGGEPPLLHRRA